MSQDNSYPWPPIVKPSFEAGMAHTGENGDVGSYHVCEALRLVFGDKLHAKDEYAEKHPRHLSAAYVWL
jgi:hypothetical protein